MQNTFFHRYGRRADLPVWTLKPGKAETTIMALLGVAFISATLMLFTDGGVASRPMPDVAMARRAAPASATPAATELASSAARTTNDTRRD